MKTVKNIKSKRIKLFVIRRRKIDSQSDVPWSRKPFFGYCNGSALTKTFLGGGHRPMSVGQDRGVPGTFSEAERRQAVPGGVQHQVAQRSQQRRRRRAAAGGPRCHGHQEQEQNASPPAQGRSRQLEGQLWRFNSIHSLRTF